LIDVCSNGVFWNSGCTVYNEFIAVIVVISYIAVDIYGSAVADDGQGLLTA